MCAGPNLCGVAGNIEDGADRAAEGVLPPCVTTCRALSPLVCGGSILTTLDFNRRVTHDERAAEVGTLFYAYLQIGYKKPFASRRHEVLGRTG